VNEAFFAPPVPVPDPDTVGFWDALRDGRFVMDRCTECRAWQHPPQEACRRCGGPTTFEAVNGTGTIFSFIVVRQQTVPGHEAPYVIGLVELDEQPGLRLTARVDADPADVTIGARVQARLVEIGDSGFRAPEFELAGT